MRKLILTAVLLSASSYAQLNQTNIKKGFKTPEELMQLFFDKETLKKVSTIIIPVDQTGKVLKESILIIDKKNREIKRQDTDVFCQIVGEYIFEAFNDRVVKNFVIIND